MNPAYLGKSFLPVRKTMGSWWNLLYSFCEVIFIAAGITLLPLFFLHPTYTP